MRFNIVNRGGMVRKLGKILCSMFLFVFLAMTLHKHNRSYLAPEELTNRNVTVP